MPFTPYHVGPGLLLKAVLPRHFSLTAFTVTQIAVDVEPLYHLVGRQTPVHGPAHSLLVASAIGVAVGAALRGITRAEAERSPAGLVASARRLPGLRAEFSLTGSLAGGLLGGLTHVLLDATTNADVLPFWPASDQNPLLGLATPAALRLDCVLAGVLGLVALAARSSLWRNPRRVAD
jgi:hypothetical protein